MNYMLVLGTEPSSVIFHQSKYGINKEAKSRKYRRMFEMSSPEKSRQVREKNWSQQAEHMQVPNGDGTRCPEE